MRRTEEVEIGKIDLEGNIREEINKETVKTIKETIRARQKKNLQLLINPINVEKKEDGRYNLIDGKQRLIAMTELNFDRIEVFVSEKHPMKNWQSHDENRANSDMHWIDYGKFYTEQHEKGISERLLAKRSGRNRQAIHEYLKAYKVFLCHLK